MGKRRNALGLVAALLLAAGGGCKKSAPPAPAPVTPTSSAAATSETVARIHWLGKDRLAAETNAAAFMRIWRSPESARLEAQTLEKLSHAPWRLLYGDTATNGAQSSVTDSNSLPVTRHPPLVTPQSALLQPLLADLVQAESYLEVRQPTNQPPDLAFAIRLNDQHAKLWETNLAAVLESLTGNKTVPAAGGGGWQINLSNQLSTLNSQPATSSQPATFNLQLSTLSLTRSSDWTLIGLSQSPAKLVGDFASRIGRDHAPFGTRETNFWLEANLDLGRLGVVPPRGWPGLDIAPTVYATAIGDGTDVRTRAELDFPNPLPLVLKPWTVPTNVVQSPLVGFTAVRGIRPALLKLPLFSAFPSNSVPDQFYVWDPFRTPFDVFFAVPLNQATNVLDILAPMVSGSVNPRLRQNLGSVSLNTNEASLNWVGLPHATPFLQAIRSSESQFLFGGFAPYVVRKSPMPPEMLAHIVEGTNLVFFDWELTSERLPHWRYLDDVYRIVFDLHGPRLMDTASYYWILNNMTNLSHSVTEVRLADKNRLTIARKSTVGLTGLEINMLANWLELPEFPRGLTTLMATNPTPIIKRKRP